MADGVPSHPGTTPGPPRRTSEKPTFKNMVVSVSSPPKDLYTLNILPVTYQIRAYPPRAWPKRVKAMARPRAPLMPLVFE